MSHPQEHAHPIKFDIILKLGILLPLFLQFSSTFNEAYRTDFTKSLTQVEKTRVITHSQAAAFLCNRLGEKGSLKMSKVSILKNI